MCFCCAETVYHGAAEARVTPGSNDSKPLNKINANVSDTLYEAPIFALSGITLHVRTHSCGQRPAVPAKELVNSVSESEFVEQ